MGVSKGSGLHKMAFDTNHFETLGNDSIISRREFTDRMLKLGASIADINTYIQRLADANLKTWIKKPNQLGRVNWSAVNRVMENTYDLYENAYNKIESLEEKYKFDKQLIASLIDEYGGTGSGWRRFIKGTLNVRLQKHKAMLKIKHSRYLVALGDNVHINDINC